jgi:hypothetical protein
MNRLTSDFNWLYIVFEPHVTRNRHLQLFIILSKQGSIGVCEFKEVNLKDILNARTTCYGSSVCDVKRNF